MHDTDEVRTVEAPDICNPVPLANVRIGSWLRRFHAARVIRYRSLHDENRSMSAMPRKRRLAIKALPVAMGHIRNSVCQRINFDVMEPARPHQACRTADRDRKSTRLNSSHLGISYAVFC